MTTEREIVESELHALLLQEQDYQATHKFYDMFPDEGPFRRELYPKHIEFFGLGKKYQERCFMGGNGCISPWTRIETADGSAQIAGFAGSSGFVVRSWDGESQCDARAGGVFLKEFAPAFRFHLDNGHWFDASHKHRVLTTLGWIEVGQLIHLASGLRCSGTRQDSQASCGQADDLYGEQPRQGEGIDLAQPLAAGDALERIRLAVAHGDAGGHTQEYSRSRRLLALPSRIYDPKQIAALCERYADPSDELASRWCESTRLECQQLAAAFGPRPEGSESWSDQGLWSASASGGCTVGHAQPGIPGRSAQEPRTSSRFVQPILPGQWPEESLDGELGDWMFCPSWHAPLVGGARITAVVPLGVQPIMDMTVEDTSAYMCAGIVHHNTGKTWGIGAYELTCHLTGEYPFWWNGRRFSGPISAWACGDTRETVRDIIQAKLLGEVSKMGDTALGTGMIPRERIIGEPRYIANTNKAADFVNVQHISGGVSQLGFKAYEQGRKAFQGTEKHVILLDEEPPFDVYLECLMRGRTVNGMTILTFTPLSGLSDVVNDFLAWERRNQEGASKITVTCGWDDVPHLDEAWKRQTEAATPPYLREARKLGIPTSGIGKVYPIEEEAFVIPPVEIPAHWRRVFGFDHGYFNTAAVWIAYDKDEDIAYIYSDYKRGEVTLDLHAMAILARGDWIPGTGDAAARDGASGEQIMALYKARGVKMTLPNKAVDAGIQEVFSRLSTGKLKVFNTCVKWLDEFRKYRYDEKQRIVKQHDHLMDATRYGIMSGLKLARSKKQQVFHVNSINFG